MAGNNSGFQRPPRVKTPLDNPKLKLSAPCPVDPSKKSNLVWGIYEGNPRISVYIGDPEGKKVEAKIDAPVFEAFLQLIERAATEAPEWKTHIDNMNFVWFGGKKSDSPELVSRLSVGKEKDGQIWISVTDKVAPKVRFFFVNPDMHSFVHGDGTAWTHGETSAAFAKSMVSILRNTMSELFVKSWPEVEAAQKKRNEEMQAKRAGGGGGGYTQRAAPAPAAAITADDFPF